MAAAYRYPEDTRPGIGMAYEAFPGRTPYTRNSELQNAETSAWGRAIVAALAADTRKHGVASADEIRNRQADREAGAAPTESSDTPEPNLLRNQILLAIKEKGLRWADVAKDFQERTKEDIRSTTNTNLLSHYLGHLRTHGLHSGEDT